MQPWIILFYAFSILTGKSFGQDADISEKSNSRNALIDIVLKKINKISSESVQNITNGDGDKELNIIESKLKKAAETSGDKGEKYVKLIMRGIRTDKNKLKVSKKTNIVMKTEEKGQSKNNTNNTRLSMIDSILKKINKISLVSERNDTADENEDILGSIENKLRKAAIPLGAKGEKYVKLIMQGIRNNKKDLKINELARTADKRRYFDNISTGKPPNSMLKYVVEKIGKLSLDSLRDTSNHGEVEKKFESLENKLKVAAQPLGEKGKKYVDLIMRAVKSGVNRNKGTFSKEVDKVVDDAVQLNDIVKIDKNNHELRNQAVKDLAVGVEKLFKKYRRMKRVKKLIDEIKMKTFESMKRNDILKNNDDIRSLSDFIVDGINTVLIRRNLGKHTIEKSEGNFDTGSKTTKSLSSQIKLCEDTYNSTCSSIRNMNLFKCAYANEIILLKKLCDGTPDCTDKSDEKYCIEKAIDKLHFARDALFELDISLEKDCFTNDISGAILLRQNLILRDVLKAQLHFIGKYNSERVSKLKRDSNDERTKSITKEITDILSTLSMTLEKALCSRHLDSRHLRRFNEVFTRDEDDPWPEDTWAPTTCACPGELCLNCTYPCKRICWHKLSLPNWNCESVNETSIVPLSVLCDGKFDCYDESDEKGCFSESAISKFEAHRTFSEITNSLKIKATKDYKNVKIDVWALINTLSNLEKLSLNSNPNPASLRSHRNECFSLLTLIYSKMLKYTSYAYEAENLYVFLLSINQQLGYILKRIGTGNKKTISEGCFCRAGKCAASFCPRKCVKACTVELKLTKYYCEGNSNVSIQIDNICNGVDDCPQRDDERDCSKEICRSHHITVLRLKVQNAGLKRKGTAMGEVLETWKAKVIGTLKIAERAGKPTPKIIKELIKEILRDLVLTYGAVEEYRRKDNNYALQDFTTIARSVLEVLWSCGK